MANSKFIVLINIALCHDDVQTNIEVENIFLPGVAFVVCRNPLWLTLKKGQHGLTMRVKFFFFLIVGTELKIEYNTTTK